MLHEFQKDNLLSWSNKEPNKDVYNLNGNEIGLYPWNDNPSNLDPDNNNQKRFDNWTLKKVKLKGCFKLDPIIGIVFDDRFL